MATRPGGCAVNENTPVATCPHTSRQDTDSKPHEHAKHFKLGPKAYAGGIYPWREPIRAEMRPETLSLGPTDFPPNVTRS